MELQGWKQIAAYFDVTERTVQNWVRNLNMPVHHLPGLKGRVFAYTDEMYAWKLAGPPPLPKTIRKGITFRLTEDQLQKLQPLISEKFSTMQDFLSHAVAHYAKEYFKVSVQM